VVRVAVAAVVVIGDDARGVDVGDDREHVARLVGLVARAQRGGIQRAERHGHAVVAPLHAGVDVAAGLEAAPARVGVAEEAVVGDPEGRHRVGQLGLAVVGEGAEVALEVPQPLGDDVAALPARAGEDGDRHPVAHEARDGAARDDALVVGVRVHEEHVLVLGTAGAGSPIGASGRAGDHPAILAAARAADAGRTGGHGRLDAPRPSRYCARGKASLTYISPHSAIGRASSRPPPGEAHACSRTT
jgi:hypothetical protein